MLRIPPTDDDRARAEELDPDLEDVEHVIAVRTVPERALWPFWEDYREELCATFDVENLEEPSRSLSAIRGDELPLEIGKDLLRSRPASVVGVDADGSHVAGAHGVSSVDLNQSIRRWRQRRG